MLIASSAQPLHYQQAFLLRHTMSHKIKQTHSVLVARATPQCAYPVALHLTDNWPNIQYIAYDHAGE